MTCASRLVVIARPGAANRRAARHPNATRSSRKAGRRGAGWIGHSVWVWAHRPVSLGSWFPSATHSGATTLNTSPTGESEYRNCDHAYHSVVAARILWNRPGARPSSIAFHHIQPRPVPGSHSPVRIPKPRDVQVRYVPATKR
jgi:hypothetical protein